MLRLKVEAPGCTRWAGNPEQGIAAAQPVRDGSMMHGFVQGGGVPGLPPLCYHDLK